MAQPAATSVNASAVDSRRPCVVVALAVMLLLPSPPWQAWGQGHASIDVEYGLIRQYPDETVIKPPAQLSVLAGHGMQMAVHTSQRKMGDERHRSLLVFEEA